MIEDADQGKQSHVGQGFVPVIERGVERRLSPHEADDRAEDDRHPQQRSEASAESDAAKRGENEQDNRSQAKPGEHLGRSQFSW